MVMSFIVDCYLLFVQDGDDDKEDHKKPYILEEDPEYRDMINK